MPTDLACGGENHVYHSHLTLSTCPLNEKGKRSEKILSTLATNSCDGYHRQIALKKDVHLPLQQLLTYPLTSHLPPFATGTYLPNSQISKAPMHSEDGGWRLPYRFHPRLSSPLASFLRAKIGKGEVKYRLKGSARCGRPVVVDRWDLRILAVARSTVSAATT